VTTIYCSVQVRRSWPAVAEWWATMYPQLFDDKDLQLTGSQPGNHFAEWFAAIHLFHRDGHLSLIEKYIYEAHPAKLQQVARLGDGLLEELRKLRQEMHVQPPDLLVYSEDGLLGFAEVKGPGDRSEPNERQCESHRRIAEVFGVPTEVIRVLERDIEPGHREQSGWRWHEGAVDPACEHIELRYGDASRDEYGRWTPVALIGRPKGRTFPVRWLLTTSAHPEIISEVQRELTFYLIEHPREHPATGHPWGYAVYHCGTGANMYSMVHWSHYPSGQDGDRHSSTIIQLSADEATQLLGNRKESNGREDE